MIVWRFGRKTRFKCSSLGCACTLSASICTTAGRRSLSSLRVINPTILTYGRRDQTTQDRGRAFTRGRSYKRIGWKCKSSYLILPLSRAAGKRVKLSESNDRYILTEARKDRECMLHGPRSKITEIGLRPAD